MNNDYKSLFIDKLMNISLYVNNNIINNNSSHKYTWNNFNNVKKVNQYSLN